MKIMMLIASALAGLAVSGVFASAASAEGTQGPTHGFLLCERMDPAVEANLADPSRTEQEIQEVWDAYVLQSCATFEVPASEADAAGRFIDACLRPHMPSFSKAEAKACIAAWKAQSETGTARTGGIGTARHGKAKRRHHKPKRHSHAEIALARTLGAR
jgi:hypothetical protein